MRVNAFKSNAPPRCAIHARVNAIESTPSPTSFIFKTDEILDERLTDLQGTTYRAAAQTAPSAVNLILAIDGVTEVYAMRSFVTVSKKPAAPWDAVLPLVVAALGGAVDGLQLETTTATPSKDGAGGGVLIRLQVSQRLPIQVEAAGVAGLSPPQRAKLSPRFAGAMSLLIAQGDADIFFKGRSWLERGLRYPDEQEGDDDADGADAAERERRSVEAALLAEVAEVEAAYPDDRLAAIVAGYTSTPPPPPSGAALALRDVDALIEAADEAERADDDVLSAAALGELAAFVASGGGELGARRNAIAYLGGSAGRGGDAVFDAVGGAFAGDRAERAPSLRRTAGDALSDLGDAKAVPLALAALGEDRSPLVRWRAARILGELGRSAMIVKALRQAAADETRFEVAFEIKDAARKVGARAAGDDGAAGAGPVWRQIQDGMRGG